MNNQTHNLSEEERTQRMIELSNQYAGLNSIQITVENVKRYFEILSLIVEDRRTPNQKLWLLAYESANAKFAPGTDESLLAGTLALGILEECIPNKE